MATDDIPNLILQLDNPNWIVANTAAEQLATLGEDGAQALFAELQQSMAGPDRQRTSVLLRALALIPQHGAPLLGELLADQGSNSPVVENVKALSALGLSQMGAEGQRYIAAAAQEGDPTALNALSLLGQEGLPTLAALASHGSLSIPARRAAMQSLVALGQPALAAQSAFFEAQIPLQQAWLIANALGPLHAANPLLRHVADNPQAIVRVRAAAVVALGQTAAEPQVTVPLLLTFLTDDQPAELRQAAVTALAAYGPAAGDAIAPLMTLLAAAGDPLQGPAALALARIAPGRAETIHSLAAHLLPCNDLTAPAAQALGAIGLPAQSLTTDLLAVLAECEGEGAALQAAVALGKVAPPAPAVIERLAGVLAAAAATDAPLAAAAATSLGELGPAALPALAAALIETPSATTKADIAAVLVDVGDVAAPILLEALLQSDADLATQQAAADGLHQIGPDILPLLTLTLRRDDRPERQRIVDALYSFDSAAFPAFQVALADDTLTVDRARLEQIFGHFQVDNLGNLSVDRGMAVPGALPYLIQHILPVTATLPQNLVTVHVIGWIGPEAAAAAPVLAQALASDNSALQCEAALALVRIGPGAAAAAPALAQALAAAPATACSQTAILEPIVDGTLNASAPEIPLQHLLIDALRTIGPPAQVGIPQLMAKMSEPALRRRAAEALGAIGVAAHAPLLDQLRSAAANSDVDLRRAAAYALHQSSAAWEPSLAVQISDLAQAAGENRHVAAMLAAGLAKHGYSVAELQQLDWQPLVAQACWTAPVIASPGGILVLGYDLYSDTCLYADLPVAPLVEGFLEWWEQTFG